MFVPEPQILDVLAVAVPQWGATILTIKGVASVICNNLPTQKWGKLGSVLEWIASNNKEAKKVGDTLHDLSVDDINTINEMKGTLVSRILNKLS